MVRIMLPAALCALGFAPLTAGPADAFATGIAAFVGETQGQLAEQRQDNNQTHTGSDGSAVVDASDPDFVIVPDSVFSATFVIYQDMLGQTTAPAPGAAPVPLTMPVRRTGQVAKGKVIKPGLGWSTGMFR